MKNVEAMLFSTKQKLCPNIHNSLSTSESISLPEPSSLSFRQFYDEKNVIELINKYVKNNWNLDKKFMYTIEKIEASSVLCCVNHQYFKVNI